MITSTTWSRSSQSSTYQTRSWNNKNTTETAALPMGASSSSNSSSNNNNSSSRLRERRREKKPRTKTKEKRLANFRFNKLGALVQIIMYCKNISFFSWNRGELCFVTIRTTLTHSYAPYYKKVFRFFCGEMLRSRMDKRFKILFPFKTVFSKKLQFFSVEYYSTNTVLNIQTRKKINWRIIEKRYWQMCAFYEGC